MSGLSATAYAGSVSFEHGAHRPGKKLGWMTKECEGEEEKSKCRKVKGKKTKIKNQARSGVDRIIPSSPASLAFLPPSHRIKRRKRRIGERRSVVERGEERRVEGEWVKKRNTSRMKGCGLI